jgi:hypothetical protein
MNVAYFSLIRPIGAFLLSAFGAYCHYKGIAIEPALHAVFDGAFPGWMYSRHVTLKNSGG